MKRFIVGNLFNGISHADLINNALGTKFKSFQPCSLDLKDFGASDVFAWFIFMDGTTHGYEDGWKWKNLLTENGNVIRETNVGDKNKLYDRRGEYGYRPFRLAFRLDPFETGNRYCCKFVGAFRLKKFLNEDMTCVEYEKVLDEVTINFLGDAYNEYHLSKNDFIKDSPVYNSKIEALGFSQALLSKLKNFGIKTLSDLLELPDGNGAMAVEIRDRIYNFLKEQ